MSDLVFSNKDNIQELLDGWKDSNIPGIQRFLVEKQLNDMYKGNPIPIFQIFADAIKECSCTDCRVLEIGCATGYYHEIVNHLLGQEIPYVGVDYSESMIRLAKKKYPGINFIVADGANLPFGDEEFPIVVSSCYLLHVLDYPKHIIETVRVAKNFVICHRTQVCHKKPTGRFIAEAYGSKFIKVVFNENELLKEFRQNGLKLYKTFEYETDIKHDKYEVSYVFKKEKEDD